MINNKINILCATVSLALISFGAVSGTGVFVDSGQNLGEGAVFSLAVADVDNDGDLDIVFAQVTAGFQVFLNDGSGGFSDSGQVVGINKRTFAVALADFNGNGYVDLVVGNDSGPSNIYFNDGTGIFTDSGQSLGSSDTQALAVGDMDNDGDIDIVAGNFGQYNRVYRNNGTGIFNSSFSLKEPNKSSKTRTQAIAVGDFNGDGRLDVYAGNIDEDTVYMSNEYGQLRTVEKTGGKYHAPGVAVGNINNDSYQDVVTAGWLTYNRVRKGSGLAVSHNVGKPNDYTWGVALGDINGDGYDDLVEANALGNVNKLYFNDGSGTFYGNSQSLGDNNSRAIALADLDGDGDLDIVIGHQDEPASIYFNN
ncbi:FG-GAP repeat domain-containing protein [Pseudoalteromonas sp. JB197]|uniref:FG-GAP repeat domain-containing protein n=1 Tax=Pseudoalteromonas sp. JB197 TaxID=1434839 RepID=UPI00097F323B|nr:VCBS repeat-containing protein [Pseudoalteromonas sp. JB197]PCC13429.1 VCBS repeat-containing protein [Pseudoalteromonas sp. JB197]SJN33106.1 hypothetical protein CZ797_07160 [Pseudoalteromonas sp. JB197]